MDQENLNYRNAKACHNKSHLPTKNQETQVIITTRDITGKQGTQKFQELEKLTDQLEKVIDQIDNNNLKINAKRSLNHLKTQFLDLISQNTPITNG